MQITVNDEIHNFDIEKMSVYELIQRIGIENKKYAIECNGAIIPKSELKDRTIQQGDKFEIVGAVGGG